MIARAFIFASLLLLSSSVTAQETKQDGAQKIDSFGDILDSDWLARLDNFAIALQSAPGSKGYVAAYMVRNKFPGFPLRRANWAVGYLIEARRIAPEHLSVINGGFANDITFELWVADANAPPVKPFDPALLMSGEKNPLLFDRFFLYDSSDGPMYESYLSLKGRYEPYATVLNADPALRGSIIAYRRRGQRRGTDRKLAARTKQQLTTSHSVDVRRVVAIGGGVRSVRTVELWLVPPGSPLPKPSPSTKRRR